MPAWSREPEPVLLPGSDDYADMLARAARKRRARLSRIAAASTVPVVAVAVAVAIRPQVEPDTMGLTSTSESPSPSRPARPSASLSRPPSPSRPAGAATRSPAATRRPGPATSRPSRGQPSPSVLPPARPTSRPTDRPPVPPGALRVEAEDGGFANPNCGDDGPMRVEAHGDASGGHHVFHPGDECTQAFPAQPGRVVTRIRFSVGGVDGVVCGWFEIGGGMIGRTATGCWQPFQYVTVPVDAQYVDGANYTIRWRVDLARTPSYVNAQVDFHELDRVGRLGR